MARNIFTRLDRRELRAAQYEEIVAKARSVKTTLSVLPGCAEQKAVEAGMKARASARKAQALRESGSYVAAFEWDIREMHYVREGSLFSNPDCDYNVLADREVEMTELAFSILDANTRVRCWDCDGAGRVLDADGNPTREQCAECKGRGSIRRSLSWFDSPNGQSSRSTRLRGIIQGVVVTNSAHDKSDTGWYAFLVATTTSIVQLTAGRPFASKEDGQMWVEREIYDFVLRYDRVRDRTGMYVPIKDYRKGGDNHGSTSTHTTPTASA